MPKVVDVLIVWINIKLLNKKKSKIYKKCYLVIARLFKKKDVIILKMENVLIVFRNNPIIINQNVIMGLKVNVVTVLEEPLKNYIKLHLKIFLIF